MFWFSQISLNRLTHSSAICFTSFFLLTVQEMHTITQSLSRLHSPRRQAPGTKRVIPPFGQEHARQQYKPSANLQISWSLGHTAPLPALFLTTQPQPVPSCWLACVWASPAAWARPATSTLQPPWTGLSKSHQSCPGTVASLILAPSHVPCVPFPLLPNGSA